MFLALSWSLVTDWHPHLQAADSGTAGLMERYKTLTDRGQHAQALGPAQELYRAHPKNQVYIQQLAATNQVLGNYRQAAALWEEFVQYSPTPTEACPQIGNAYRSDGQNNKAIDAFRRCLGFEAKSPDVLAALGNTLASIGSDSEAQAAYEQGLEYDSRDADLSMGLARLGLRLGKADAAAKAAEEVLGREPENPDALYVAGLAAERQGRIADAQGYLEHAARLTTRDTDVQQALERVRGKKP
jgi:tetratricopeptide (TPR) repeat protein